MLDLRRRRFITLLVGAAAWPLAARAQQPERMRRIGVLMGLPEDDPETKACAAKLRQELERLGWSEGRNVHIDTRFAPAGAQAQVLAQELVGLQPDVLLAHSAQIAAARLSNRRARGWFEKLQVYGDTTNTSLPAARAAIEHLSGACLPRHPLFRVQSEVQCIGKH
jgi:hypothetical protein